MVRFRSTEVIYSISTYDRFLTIAFQADVENFLLKFEKLYSLRFSDFASVWKEMQFSYVNSGQHYYTFIRQFVENCFFVLKKFIVYPKNIFTEVGALYLLYALYFKQLIKDWVKIRITLDEYLKLQDLVERLRQEQQLEPLFCYAKLLTNNAFEFVFQKKPLAPESSSIKCKLTLDLKGILNEDNFLEKFTKTVTNYKDALSKFSVENPGLGIFESTILEEIQSTVDSLEKSTEPMELPPEDNSIYERRTKIKDKAMSVRAANFNAGLKVEIEESVSE
ncbi:hypothetical protein WA026_016688 [Henosepilachna vigintioctopunctata]|uniref:snRNA-activating protein complex subunit 1 n=1 Tax=Henosepilachna vigintioctopunctata TaxID=420089 RepID=A0AAW1V3F2_9CUCU